MTQTANPLIVQSDMSLLLEVYSPLFEETREAIAPFAEIVKSPDHIHTYRITPLSLWNAGAAGVTSIDVIERLKKFSKFPIPEELLNEIGEIMERFGAIEIQSLEGELTLKIKKSELAHLFRNNKLSSFLQREIDPHTFTIKKIDRGLIKQALIKEGYPAIDLGGYAAGDQLASPLTLRANFQLRPYQKRASDAFFQSGSKTGGSGVIVLPCGAGKTATAIAIMAKMQCHTLILTTGTTAVRQWKRELIEKSEIQESDLGEYSGEIKEVAPITLSTYQILVHRKSREDEFSHFDFINSHPWGLIIYDEVHLLPAQLFQFTASLQAIRRLGLTATLIREDRREEDVFSLIGPKCFDIPWKEVEQQGWIAKTKCIEIRLPLPKEERITYAKAENRERFRIASENSNKLFAIKKLIDHHLDDLILVIGQFIDQVEWVADQLNLPLITGKTPESERELLYSAFRRGEKRALVTSSVANFAIDLPDASVLIQISGKFGSRQEEAQRLGRVLRPKRDGRTAHFYTLVTEETEEQRFAFKRQLFLIEQGYSYQIIREFL